MKKSGFGSPLLFSVVSLVGALLIASTYLYTAFILRVDTPSSRPDLEKKGLTEEQIDNTLREENTKNLEKYLPAEEIDKIKKQEEDSKIKSDIGSLATELQAYYTTPGKGKYPSSLDTLVKEGIIRQLPQTQSGENYQYIVCLDFSTAVLFSQLKADNGYWAWSSFENQAKLVTALPNEQSCSIKQL